MAEYRRGAHTVFEIHLHIDTATSDDQSIDAMAEREECAPSDGGVSAHQEAGFGEAFMDTRIFLLQFWQMYLMRSWKNILRTKTWAKGKRRISK